MTDQCVWHDCKAKRVSELYCEKHNDPAKRKVLPKRHRPGSSWRTLVHPWHGAKKMRGWPIADGSDKHEEATEFDELVVDQWFHLEQMDNRDWWIGLYKEDGSSVMINISVGDHGQARHILIEEEEA